MRSDRMLCHHRGILVLLGWLCLDDHLCDDLLLLIHRAFANLRGDSVFLVDQSEADIAGLNRLQSRCTLNRFARFIAKTRKQTTAVLADCILPTLHRTLCCLSVLVLLFRFQIFEEHRGHPRESEEVESAKCKESNQGIQDQGFGVFFFRAFVLEIDLEIRGVQCVHPAGNVGVRALCDAVCCGSYRDQFRFGKHRD